MTANVSLPPVAVAGVPRATPLPGARTALILLLTINLFNYIDRYVLAAVAPNIEETFFPVSEYPIDPQTGHKQDPTIEGKIGSLSFAFMLAYMVTAPLFGWLADRMSRWLLVGIGVILWSLASGASGLAAGFVVLWITRCFVGVGEGAYGPVAPTLIADFYPVERRGSVLAWFYAAIPVGSALGFALGGAITWLTEDWRWGFYLVVAPGLLLGLLCFRRREPPRGQTDAAATTRTAGWKDYAVLLRTPSYVLNTLGMMAMTFASGGIAFWMPTYVVKTRQWGNTFNVNLTFSVIVVLAGLGGTLLGGITGDRLRPRYPGAYFLVSGIAMLLGFPMVLAVLWLPFPFAWVFVFLACFCLFFNTGPTNTILANVTHPSVRATGFALNIFVIHALGDAVSPGVIGLVSGYSNMNVGFLVVSGMFLVSGLLWLWGTRYLARDTELAPLRLGPADGAARLD